MSVFEFLHAKTSTDGEASKKHKSSLAVQRRILLGAQSLSRLLKINDTFQGI